MSPSICTTAVIRPDGYYIGLVREGETGYYRRRPEYDQRFSSYKEACDEARAMNKRLGIPELEAWEMTAKSMRNEAGSV